MTSTHRSAAAQCGSGRNNDRPTKTTTKTAATKHFRPFTWNAALNVCAALILLNTVGLISNSVARADTIQYPVTAAIGSVIPPGKTFCIFLLLQLQ